MNSSGDLSCIVTAKYQFIVITKFKLLLYNLKMTYMYDQVYKLFCRLNVCAK